MKWDHAADAKLLAAILRIHKIKPDYPALALAMGDGCTPKALTHRFAKLKSVAAGTTALDGTTLDSTPTPTPRKRGRPKKTTSATELGNGNEDGDDEEVFAPVKKRGGKRGLEAEGGKEKGKGKGRGGVVKKEEGGEEEKEGKGEGEMGESDGDTVEGGEDLPLGREIKVEDGVIRVEGGGDGKED